MFRPNDNFNLLPESYLFSEVAKRIREFRADHPDADIIRMDIGDVSLPLPECIIKAMHKAVDDQASQATFHGYGPEQGYSFLRDSIAEWDYNKRGIAHITADDIFISDGAKSDIGNIGDLFGKNIRVAVTDPVYPVYVDSNVIDGRAGILSDGRWSNILYLECTAENGFRPLLPADGICEVIYLCFPNNPTGTTSTKDELRKWVEYALRNEALIIYDSAYEAYITSDNVPRSIFEIEGAEHCAIEVRSFSKTAGFTGMRCGYTVVPRTLKYRFSDGKTASLHDMWNRRQCTKFNGASYIVQRGAAALYTPEGREAIAHNVGLYMKNAHTLREALLAKGYIVAGGVDSPYVWFKTPGCKTSWQLFEQLLHDAHITSTPGAGFGKAGEGYLRFTGFNSEENTIEAVKRITNC